MPPTRRSWRARSWRRHLRLGPLQPAPAHGSARRGCGSTRGAGARACTRCSVSQMEAGAVSGYAARKRRTRRGPDESGRGEGVRRARRVCAHSEAPMYDVLIRGGTLIDGSGAPARTGDLAIADGRIVEIGRVSGAARRVIDADGLAVTPGFVDVHTHYDGQATWDPLLSPSCFHGVTTIVMGNCGVGFAPVRPDQHAFLIELMEGVEDIPGTALHEGISWEWETFPQYLDALAKRRFALDVATQVPHGAVRGYVMGERGARNEPATAEDIAAMAAIVKEGVAAGALGFSSSRTLLHRAVDGECVPGTFAAADEMIGIGRVLGELGRGVLEVASDLMPEDPELGWMERLSRETGRPVTFACLQNDADPAQWLRLLAAAEAVAGRGGRITPQIAARPTSVLMGLQSSIHPFVLHEGYRAISDLPLDERVRRLRDPAVRERILAEKIQAPTPLIAFILQAFHKLFALS